MTDLLELAAQCEAAEGADKELDAAIMAAFTDMIGTRPLWMLRAKIATGAKGTHQAPKFTASTDAAMTLVPDDAFWAITMRGIRRGGFHAACAMVEGEALDWRASATPALAICAAALRARAAVGNADAPR